MEHRHDKEVVYSSGDSHVLVLRGHDQLHLIHKLILATFLILFVQKGAWWKIYIGMYFWEISNIVIASFEFVNLVFSERVNAAPVYKGQRKKQGWVVVRIKIWHFLPLNPKGAMRDDVAPEKRGPCTYYGNVDAAGSSLYQFICDA